MLSKLRIMPTDPSLSACRRHCIMSITPTTSIPRGAEPSLQTFYYHSSLFISALREDIDLLLTTYAHTYSREAFEPEKPFELFKSVWKSLGWNYAHLVCMDAKRPTFVSTVGRCFVERVADTSENLLRRAAALFGLYIWYMTQPKNTEVNIPVADYITVPVDIYEMILQMHTSYASPLRTYITYVISQLLSQSLFHIIPSSKYHPQNPRDLPHNMPLLTRDIEAGHSGGWRKRGRPSQLDQAQRAEKVLSELEAFLNDKNFEVGTDNETPPHEAPDPSSSESYLALKQQLKESVPSDLLKMAEETTLRRVEAAEEHIKRKYLNTQDVHYEGLDRLREQIQQGGLLDLFHGYKDSMCSDM